MGPGGRRNCHVGVEETTGVPVGIGQEFEHLCLHMLKKEKL